MLLRKHASVFKPSTATANAVALSILQVAAAMNFPVGIDLSQRETAVVELSGMYFPKSINQFCDSLGVARPNLVPCSVDGAKNGPIPDPQGADVEQSLDICILAALLPGSTIYVIDAPNTGTGIADGVQYACDKLPKLDALSLSWGAPESQWDASDMAVTNTAIQNLTHAGIGFYAAAGDNGSDDGVGDGNNHVDFPASSPYGTGVGGTTLTLDSQGQRLSETTWGDPPSNDNGATGGGVSSTFPLLSFQPTGFGNFRLVPDVACNADPTTGYEIESDFAKMTVGGTSGAAPLYAALHGRLASYFPQKLGCLNELFYNLRSSVFYDVVSGSNGAFSAGAGFDLTSGNGCADGTLLLHHLVLSGHLVKAQHRMAA